MYKLGRQTLLLLLVILALVCEPSCGGGGGTINPVVTGDNPTVSENAATMGGDTVAVSEDASDVVKEMEPDSTTGARGSFMLVSIPDTQHATVDFPAIFDAQMQWISDNREARNIAFVLHEGDITHYNDITGWINASIGFEILDGVVPYAIAVGNHDMDNMYTHDTTTFNTYFPLSRFEDSESFGGSYPAGTMDNSYHYFSAGDVDWLVLSLIYLPGADVLVWADGIAEEHPNRRIIVVTHAFIGPDNEIGNDADNLWNNFVRKHSNITMVFNGHYTSGQYGRAELTGDSGNSVYGMFANYQKSRYGGAGYMRLITVDAYGGAISVETYSPWEDAFKTDDGNEFEYTDVDMSSL